MDEDPRRYAPAAGRNKDVILDVLTSVLPPSGTLLEIGSGSGEHAAYMAPRLPGWRWQPTDRDEGALPGIDAHARDSDASGRAILPAVPLDVCDENWKIDGADAVFSANVIHIAPWEAGQRLIQGAAKILAQSNGLLIFYGPFFQSGVPTAQGNLRFDQQLRSQNPAMGIRQLEDVVATADERGLDLEKVVSMPANNLTVIFRAR